MVGEAMVDVFVVVVVVVVYHYFIKKIKYKKTTQHINKH